MAPTSTRTQTKLTSLYLRKISRPESNAARISSIRPGGTHVETTIHPDFTETEQVGVGEEDLKLRGRAVTCTRSGEDVDAWCQRALAENPCVIALDCEWSPPWFRGAADEKVNVIQMSTRNECLVLSIPHESNSLPGKELHKVFRNKEILKVGVNLLGDTRRLTRDFGVKVCNVHDLATAANRVGGEKFTKARSLEQLAKVVLGMNDMAKDSGPRMSDWRLWPLTQSQVEYAALDAILTNEIFWASPKEMQEPLGLEMEDDEVQIESAAEKRRSPESSVEHDKENPARKLMKSGSVNAKSNATNFYVMMRNKSIDPPNRGTKTRPQGSKESLKGKCFVVSGVLDSMNRKECEEYILKHGGAMAKSITVKVTHVLNDHGEIGPVKLKQAQAKGIPVVSEDVLFQLVELGSKLCT